MGRGATLLPRNALLLLRACILAEDDKLLLLLLQRRWRGRCLTLRSPPKKAVEAGSTHKKDRGLYWSVTKLQCDIRN